MGLGRTRHAYEGQQVEHPFNGMAARDRKRNRGRPRTRWRDELLKFGGAKNGLCKLTTEVTGNRRERRSSCSGRKQTGDDE